MNHRVLFGPVAPAPAPTKNECAPREELMPTNDLQSSLTRPFSQATFWHIISASGISECLQIMK